MENLIQQIKRPIKLLIVVPISTAAMAHDLKALYPSTPDIHLTFLDGSGLHNCPPCIESYTDSIQSSTALLPRILEYISSTSSSGFYIDGILICCFSDHPLVYMLREQTEIAVPILGIFHASMQAAWILERQFGIVTTAYAWEEMLSNSVRVAGMESRCSGVIATRLGVLELESKQRDEVLMQIMQSTEALLKSGARCIILGCAGMSILEDLLVEMLSTEIKVIDGVKYGIQFLAALSQAERM